VLWSSAYFLGTILRFNGTCSMSCYTCTRREGKGVRREKVSELFLQFMPLLPRGEPPELPSLYNVARTEKSSRVAHKLRLTYTVHMYIIRPRVPLRPGAPGFALWKFDTNPTRKRGRRARVPLLPCRAVLRSVHLADSAFYPSTLYTMDRISAISSPHAPAPLALTLGPFDSSTF